MTDKTPKELLKEFFHFSYHVYSMDEMIEKLEQLTEKMPKWEREYNLEHGRALLQQGDVDDAIKKLKQASKNIHEVMELALDKDVKSYMDECNNK